MRTTTASPLSGLLASAADTVLACLGEREVAGSVVNTRLALRNRRR